MKISGNTILITGGATGIGFALAEAFLARDNDVIVCARTVKVFFTISRDTEDTHP